MSSNTLAVEAAAKTGALDPASQGKATEGALAALTKYIPTESVTLYVATVSAFPAFKDTIPSLNPSTVYYFYVVLSPLLLLLMFWRQRALADKPLGSPANWPLWRMSASTIAFAVWALAVPENGIITGEGAAVLAALGALFVSTVLNMVAPIFERLNPY